MNSADKQAVLHCLKSMIDEEACEECPLYGTTGTDHCEKDCVRLAINTLEQELCDDAISRQAVLEAIDAKAWEFCDYLISNGRNDEQKPVSHFADNLRECVGEDLPSVSPQPKMGRWKRINKEKYVQHAMSYYRCSECGEEIIGKHNYCPMCGCKMQEVKE